MNKNQNFAIIYPNQLFEIERLPYETKNIDLFIIAEEPIYFADKERNLKFNMLKLIFQRASMKYYEDYLKKNGLKCKYLDYEDEKSNCIDYITSEFGQNKKIHVIDPVDYLVEEKLEKSGKKNKQSLIYYDTPMFLMTDSHLEEYMEGREKFFQKDFYIWYRNKFNILMKKNEKPIGGSYSYDKFNRDSIPGENFRDFLEEKNIEYPEVKYKNKFYDEAIKYCEKTFDNHYKKNYKPENIHLYPITHEDIKNHFKSFLDYKMKYFGPYEDAIDFEESFIFHSVISPQLNNGLLDPKWVLDKTIEHYDSVGSKILYSVEGFIRQLVWREYSRLLYRYAYDNMISNYFGHHNKLSKAWYDGNTGILPIDLAIKKAFEYGYIHHIIRLMILCNFMNLCFIDPNDVYAWFMEFSLDSYDWVMINNVYSMGLYADGGLTTTKPYISTSRYVLNQSNLEKDGIWDQVWDTLYYYFIYKNYDKFTGRGKIYQGQWNKKTNKEELKKNAEKFLKSLNLNP